jgi:hypothetical protein
MQFLDLRARRRVYDAPYGFFERGVERYRGCGGGCRRRVEQLGAGEQEFAVEFEDLVELSGNVGADDVFDTYACGLGFADLRV